MKMTFAWHFLALLLVITPLRLSSAQPPQPSISIPVENLESLQLFSNLSTCSSLRRYASDNGLGTQPPLVAQLAAYVARFLSADWRANVRALSATVPDTMAMLCGCTPSAEAVCSRDERLLAALKANDDSAIQLNDMLVTVVETRNSDLRIYNERRQRELDNDEKRLQVRIASYLTLRRRV